MKKIILGLLVILSQTGVISCQQGGTGQAEETVNIDSIGEQAYYYGLQQVIFYGQRWIYTQNDSKDNLSFQGVNRLFNIRKPLNPNSGFPVVTPNATTLYGTGIIDLQDEPLVIEMPEITDRYFSLQIMDQYGIFYVMKGNQFNGTQARRYFVRPVGYAGDIPKDFVSSDVIQATSDMGYLFVRIAVEHGTPEEVKHINRLQDQITLTPLSKWLENDRKGIRNSDTPVRKGDYPVYPRMSEIANAQVDHQTPEDYFTLLHMVLNDPGMTLIADSRQEQDFLAELAKVGIGKGRNFLWGDLDPGVKEGLTKGFNAGFKHVRETLKTNLIDMNNWMVIRNSGGFETRWVDRAVMADAGWAGPDKNVSHAGAFRFVDADGEQLNSANNYTITFNMDDLPPVTQFWSLPIYNKDGYFVNNPINRYTINSFMIQQGLLHIEDEQLIIYVQKDKPTDPKKLKNWLPAPEGDFRFTARYYGPYMSIVNGRYNMPEPVKSE